MVQMKKLSSVSVPNVKLQERGMKMQDQTVRTNHAQHLLILEANPSLPKTWTAAQIKPPSIKRWLRLLTKYINYICCFRLGRAYSNWEDRLIINYIIETQRFSEVRGRTLWVDIQDIALCGILYIKASLLNILKYLIRLQQIVGISQESFP